MSESGTPVDSEQAPANDIWDDQRAETNDYVSVVPEAELPELTPGDAKRGIPNDPDELPYDAVDASTDNVSNEELAGMIGDLRSDMKSAFSDRIEFFENQARQMQQRIETLQQDQFQQLREPVFRRFAMLITQAADSEERARNHEGDYHAEVDFGFFIDKIVETLDLLGAKSVEAKVGDLFDRAIHTARKSVPTADHGQDGTLAKVLRQGLIRDGEERAFIPAEVSVYRFDATLAPVDAPPPLATPTDAEPVSIDDTSNPQPNQEGNQ